jgi:hypothetical protein
MLADGGYPQRPRTGDFLMNGRLRHPHESAKRDFLRLFPNAFEDASYLARERDYKVAAHQELVGTLGQPEYLRLLRSDGYDEIAKRLLRVDGMTNLPATFEKMALRTALQDSEGSRRFADGLYHLLYGATDLKERFEKFCLVLGDLPHGATSPVKWPIATLFPFLAHPQAQLFLKPDVTKKAAKRFGFQLNYRPALNWLTYSRLLEFAGQLKDDLADWKPRDMIDIHSFIWVTNSEGYASELIG